MVLESKYSRLVKKLKYILLNSMEIKVNPDGLNLYRFTSFSFQESEGQHYVTKRGEQ